MLPDNFWAGLSSDTLTAFFTTFWNGFLAILATPLTALANILYHALGGQ